MVDCERAIHHNDIFDRSLYSREGQFFFKLNFWFQKPLASIIIKKLNANKLILFSLFFHNYMFHLTVSHIYVKRGINPQNRF